MFSVVMMSCDKYKCLAPAFEACMDRYYPNHPKIYPIYGNDIWSKRLREGLKYMTDDYVLLMLDDMLLRQPVNEELIEDALKVLENNPKVAVINFEKNYREALPFSENWVEQKQNQMYLHSCQPSLWRRTALIDNLKKDEDAWSWEMTWINNGWRYLINKGEDIIDIGRTNDLNWGVSRGKLTNEFRRFLKYEDLYSNEIKEVFRPVKLSLITPYYKTLNEIKELASILGPQLTDEVEWIIIDDGCHETELDALPAKIIHLEQNSGGASTPRNIGLNNAQGEYIGFIDSDDSVVDNYISTLLNKINTESFDYCLFSWTYKQNNLGPIIIEDQPPEWNASIWNCIYHRNIIGETRFNPELKFAEDAVFNFAVRKGAKANIKDILYIYNGGREGSLTWLEGQKKKESV